MKKATVSLALHLVILAGAARSVSGMDLNAFRFCISASGSGSVCQLDAHFGGPYLISYPLEVGRSFITVKGTFWTSRGDTTLQRSVASAYPIMKLAAGVSNATIQDFTFDGNRALIGTLPGLQANNYIDLDLQGQFGNSSVVVQADFKNAPGFSMTTAAHYTTMQYCNATGGRIAALQMNSGDNLTVYSNTLQSYGGGAVGVGAAGPVSISNNTFFNNHAEGPYGQPGGQVFVDGKDYQGSCPLGLCSNHVTIVNNWFDGNYATGGGFTFAIEVYAINVLTVQGNEAFHHRASGYYIIGSYCVRVTPGTSGYKVESNLIDGIEVKNLSGYPNSTNLQIDQMTSISNSRYNVDINQNGVGTISTVRVTSNTLTPYSTGPAFFSSGITDLCTSANNPILSSDQPSCSAPPSCS